VWGNGEVRRRDFFVWGKEDGAELERGRRGFFRGGEEEEREGAGGEVRWGTSLITALNRSKLPLLLLPPFGLSLLLLLSLLLSLLLLSLFRLTLLIA